MRKGTRPTFKAEFKLEAAQLVLNQGYTVREAATAKNAIINYILGYYSQVRPHTHNDGVTPNLAERNYWIAYNSVAKKN